MESKIIESSTVEETVKLPLWKNLYETGKGWDYGSVHTHEEIALILGIPYILGDPNKAYRDQVRKANKALLQIGKGIKNIYACGFEVVTPGEYYKWARKHEKKSWRAIGRAITIVDHAPTELMSRPELTVHIKTRDHLSRISVFVSKERRDLTAELRAAKKQISKLRGGTDNDETSVSITE